LGCVANIE
jgi:hypothetical protein